MVARRRRFAAWLLQLLTALLHVLGERDACRVAVAVNALGVAHTPSCRKESGGGMAGGRGPVEMALTGAADHTSADALVENVGPDRNATLRADM